MNLYSQRHLVRLVSAILVERINFLTPRGGLSKIWHWLNVGYIECRVKIKNFRLENCRSLSKSLLKLFICSQPIFFFILKSLFKVTSTLIGFKKKLKLPGKKIRIAPSASRAQICLSSAIINISGASSDSRLRNDLNTWRG